MNVLDLFEATGREIRDGSFCDKLLGKRLDRRVIRCVDNCCSGRLQVVQAWFVNLTQPPGLARVYESPLVPFLLLFRPLRVKGYPKLSLPLISLLLSPDF